MDCAGQRKFNEYVDETLKKILFSRRDSGLLWLYFMRQEGTLFRSWGQSDDIVSDAEDSV